MLKALVLAVLGLAATQLPAAAYNVPGSGNLIIAPTTRMIASAQIDMITDLLSNGGVSGPNELDVTFNAVTRSMQGNGGYGPFGAGVVNPVPTAGLSAAAIVPAFAFVATPLKYDYTAVIANIAVSKLYKGTGIGDVRIGVAFNGETAEGTTDFNHGKLAQQGGGISVFGAIYRPGGYFLYGATGITGINYDMSRNFGTVNASFGARRTYVAAGGGWKYESDTVFAVATAGLKWINLHVDGYTEQGFGFGISAPGTVRSQTNNFFLANAELKVGYHMGVVSPYGVLAFQNDFLHGGGVYLDSIGQVVSLASTGRTAGSIGAGIQLQSDPYSIATLEARYTVGRDHFSDWTLRAQVSRKF